MISYHTYIRAEGAELFTAVCLPDSVGTFPTILHRDPYVDICETISDEEAVQYAVGIYRNWVKQGYAVIYQHCRGRGRSGGDCIPYIYEREDGLLLQEWVRQQPFYNGELFLEGASYTASVHFVTAPFAEDIKGAVLQVQDCQRYNCNYRGGFYKIGLHGEWYVKMYKRKSMPQKDYTDKYYNMLPLIDFSEKVLGEKAVDFDSILLHPDKRDPFWLTRHGGGEARDAIKHAGIPILLVTGFYDIYTGGVFDMWNGLDAPTMEKSALLVHPYDHGNKPDGQPVTFENASTAQVFGDYTLRWFEYVRGQAGPPVKPGQVTYYKLFGGRWLTDDFKTPEKALTFTLGEGERTYTYDPADPATFRGGLSANFGGNAWQDQPGKRQDILTFYSPTFEQNTFVKGKMQATLRVRSDCEDTCFYVRLSLEKAEGSYGLRDDINQISNVCPDYTPGQAIDMTFTFDEHAFVVQAGERIRVDVSSSAFPLYVRHTNQKGLYCLQDTAKVAHNTVICDRSTVTLFIE